MWRNNYTIKATTQNTFQEANCCFTGTLCSNVKHAHNFNVAPYRSFWREGKERIRCLRNFSFKHTGSQCKVYHSSGSLNANKCLLSNKTSTFILLVAQNTTLTTESSRFKSQCCHLQDAWNWVVSISLNLLFSTLTLMSPTIQGFSEDWS